MRIDFSPLEATSKARTPPSSSPPSGDSTASCSSARPASKRARCSKCCAKRGHVLRQLRGVRRGRLPAAARGGTSRTRCRSPAAPHDGRSGPPAEGSLVGGGSKRHAWAWITARVLSSSCFGAASCCTNGCRRRRRRRARAATCRPARPQRQRCAAMARAASIENPPAKTASRASAARSTSPRRRRECSNTTSRLGWRRGRWTSVVRSPVLAALQRRALLPPRVAV
jgi:hypothetical protein